MSSDMHQSIFAVYAYIKIFQSYKNIILLTPAIQLHLLQNQKCVSCQLPLLVKFANVLDKVMLMLIVINIQITGILYSIAFVDLRQKFM